MPSPSVKPAPTRSPLLAAIGISATIAIGAVLGSTDLATVEDAITGKWLTRAYAETQQGHTVAIAALEQSVAGVTREMDFVAAHTGASIRRGEDETYDRFAHLDAEIAALKDKIAGIESVRFLPRAAEPAQANTNDLVGLRSSLHDLATSHHSAVAAITRRLDRIEVKVGMSTDVISSRPHTAVRRTAAKPKPVPFAEDAAWRNQPERGHLFNVKPISNQGAPLRLSRLPG